MSEWRLFLVRTLILFLIAGSLFDIVQKGEHWPFSSYPMYAGPAREKIVSSLVLYGVVNEKTHTEIPLFDLQYISPFDQCRLKHALGQVKYKSEQSNQAILREALLDCLQRYELLRKQGLHKGPPFQSIKLYEQDWQLESPPTNINSPTQQILAAEVKLTAYE